MPGDQNREQPADPELLAIRKFAKEAIVTCNLDGTVISWNPAAERMFGYSSDEVLGRAVTLIVPSENRANEHEIFERVRRGERTEDYETQRVDRNGRLLHVSVTFSPIKDQIARVMGVLTIAVDLTDRKRLEDAEQARMFLSAIVSSADDAIVSKDLNGVVTSWNRAAERLFGYSQEEMIGQPISMLVPPEHPNEEPQILERIRRGERIDHYETRRRRKDGKIIDVSVTISPVRDRLGRIIGASKIARDITERKRWQEAEVAESFLASLVQSAQDAIISKDLDGVVKTWNSAAEKLFGYSTEEMVGKPITILMSRDQADEEIQILKRIRRGELIEHYETIRTKKDGTAIRVSQTISPIRDTLGRVIGVSNITRDITEQRESARRESDALRQAQLARRQAEEANRAKDEFLATVSHELRTPMTAIVGWSRLLMSGQLTPERQQRALETIDKNARSQAQLIEDLLDISRIVSGKLRIDFKPVDLAVVIAAAVEAARPTAETKEMRIQTVLSSASGPILGDAERLQQVVWNLLSNAIRYTPKAGTIRIELARVESQIELRVSDNGIGISESFLPHLFERFTQADSSTTRSGGGLGMGLAIVKSLVELHGGVVSAASAGEGKGSTFIVKLPISAIRQEEKFVQGVAAPKLAARIEEREELVGIKILVVDDEPDTCELLRFVLRQAGAIVETANGAEEALRLLTSFQPDILVSDIGMPGVDGVELLRIIRDERHSQIPAVALTAMARIEDRVKTLGAGFQMHVPKPVEPIELISIVSSLVSLINRSAL